MVKHHNVELHNLNNTNILLRNAEKLLPLQNIVRVSRVFQWNPAVMCVCVRIAATEMKDRCV